jgi:uncharacterized protein (DUF2249 family)
MLIPIEEKRRLYALDAALPCNNALCLVREEGETVMTESTTDWQLQATKRLDVRPILAEGGEPFALILETAAPLKTGETLLLIAPFEPVPLYQVLFERGFSHETRFMGAGEWWVLFTRA